MIDIPLLGSFSLLTTVLSQPGSGCRLLKGKAIQRRLFPSLSRRVRMRLLVQLNSGALPWQEQTRF